MGNLFFPLWMAWWTIWGPVKQLVDWLQGKPVDW
jgi:hypothetical protein